MNKYLTIVLKEMCSRVGANYDAIDFKHHSWYHTYSWTAEKEKEFVKWLANYMYLDRSARKELTTIHLNTKKKCKTFAENFTWNYGWKVKE
jgi:hypothetical protein